MPDSRNLAIADTWRGKTVEVELVTQVTDDAGVVTETSVVRRGVVKATKRKANSTMLEIMDVDRAALSTLIPSRTFTTADWLKLYVDHVNRPIPQGVGYMPRVPLTYIDNSSPYVYAGPEVIGGNVPALVNLYRNNVIVNPAEYTTSTTTGPTTGVVVVTHTFTAEQRDLSGALYTLEADYSCPGSRLVSDEIDRILNLAYGFSPSLSAPLWTTVIPRVGPNPSSFSRALAAYVKDWEGLLKLAKSGEVRFEGARRVANLLGNSTDLSGTGGWTFDAGMSSASGVNDPIGGTSAYTLTVSSGTPAWYRQATGVATGDVVLSSIWIRRRTGSGIVHMVDPDAGNVVITAAISSSWQRISTTKTTGSTGGYFGIRLNTVGDQVDVWHPQLEVATGQSNQNPSEYVSAGELASPYHGAFVDGVKYFGTQNGNTVSSNIVDESTMGAILTTLKGYRRETGTTNQLVRSQEFDNASWTKNNVTVAADSTAAPDGTVTADKVTENAAASVTHYTQQVPGFFSPNVSCHFKPNGRTWILFEVKNKDGNFYYASFNIGAGTVGTVTGSGASATIEPSFNGFYRCRLLVPQGLGAVSPTVTFFLATGDGTGAATYTGDGVSGAYYWGAQEEDAGALTSYIPTTTAAVTRPEDALIYPLSVISDTEGTAHAEYQRDDWANIANVNSPIIAGSNNSRGPLLTDDYPTSSFSGVRMIDNALNIVVGPSGIPSGRVRSAVNWGFGLMKTFSYLNGEGQPGAYSGSFGMTDVGIGYGSGGGAFNGTIANVEIYKHKHGRDDIARIFARFSAATKFADAAGWSEANRALIDAPYVRAIKTSAALDILLTIARAQLFITTEGAYGILIDQAKAATLSLNDQTDQIAVEEYSHPDIVKSITLDYRPQRSDSDSIYNGRFSRACNGSTGERQYKLFYLRNHVAADRLICYLQRKENAKAEASVSVYGVHLAAGDRIDIASLTTWNGTKSFIAPQIRRGPDRNQMNLLEYDATVYVYSAGTLPTEAVNV